MRRSTLIPFKNFYPILLRQVEKSSASGLSILPSDFESLISLTILARAFLFAEILVTKRDDRSSDFGPRGLPVFVDYASHPGGFGLSAHKIDK